MNKNTRLVARLDIKGPNLIKGVHLEGLRVIGSPNEHALRYYQQGADELIYMDCVASLYGRNHLGDIVSAAARDIFIPMTVGGGIRSVEDATQVLADGCRQSGGEHRSCGNPRIDHRYCTTLWQPVHGAVGRGQADFSGQVGGFHRQRKGIYGTRRCRVGQERGLARRGGNIAHIDRQGGYTERVRHTPRACRDRSRFCPVIASGGMGEAADVVGVVTEGGADAVAMADILHYKRATIGDVRQAALNAGLSVRNYG
jgi:cyclase